MRIMRMFFVLTLLLFAGRTTFSYFATADTDMPLGKVTQQFFRPLASDSLSQGLDDRIYWIRFSLPPLTKMTSSILYLDNPTLDTIDLYEDGHRIKQTGDHRLERDKNALGYVFVLDRKRTHTWYLRITSDSGIYTRLYLRDPKAHWRAVEYEKLFLTFFFGFLLSITLYNLFLFFSLRERVYLYYVAFQISIFGVFLSYSGMGNFLLWPGNVPLNEFIYRKGEILALIFALLFARTFLDVRSHFPYLDRVIQGTLVLLGYILLTPWSLHGWLFQMTLIWTVVLGFVLIGRAIVARLPDATLFFVATFSVLLGALLVFLKIFGMLGVNALTTWGVYLGSMLEAILFSIALANRIQLLKQREQELIHSQKEILEAEVARQTVSLRQMVDDKEILLNEINHRIKNNLQVISSFVTFASFHSKDKQAFQTLNQRIQAISVLYGSLYRPNSTSTVDMQVYLHHIIKEVLDIYEIDVELQFEVESITLDFDQAILVGLVVNEIVTNMLAHAFKGVAKPAIRLYFIVTKHGYRLEISDNGTGFDADRSYPGLGLKLIQRLSEKQLHGSCRIESDHKGSTFVVGFQ